MGQRGDTSVSRKQPQSHQLEGLDQTQEDNGQQSETDLSSVQHQIWESGLQTEQVNTLVQHRSGKAVSADPLATVTQSCKSDQTIFQNIEFAPEGRQRKRTKRVLPGDGC
jgi:hypothetical protein